MHRTANTAEVKGVPNVNGNLQTVITSNRQLNGNHNNNNNNHFNNTCNSPVDALPKQFIASMKTLFDILDDKHTGFVRFSDIEKGWQDDGCKGLPHGVLDSLRKLTPASGLLSFERFCAGLKLCLLRNQTEISTSTATTQSPSKNCKMKSTAHISNKSPRPPSAPLLEIENPLPSTPWSCSSGNPTATVRPRNQIINATQRTLSMPQLSPDSSELENEMATMNINTFGSPPPKPPRAAQLAAATAAVAAANGINNVRQTNSGSFDKTGIRHALQDWQMGLLLNEMGASDKNAYYNNRGSADGGSSSATDSATSAAVFNVHMKKNCSGGVNAGSSKRREPRRHTLQNGIDYNMLRRLKQYEEEREVLLLGLDAVEKTRDWYMQQVQNVQEKIRCLGRIDHVDHWSEVQQERINFQRARVLEVNRSLATLADSWERGSFPIHFNLAITHPKSILPATTPSDRNIFLTPQPNERLHSQNRYVANEVKRLERENQVLARELFELRQCLANRRMPSSRVLTISQSQSSPVCSSSSGGGGGGLVDADVVY